jgi:hypothetical protein
VCISASEERAQHGRLAALRRADDTDVAGGPGHVQPHRVAAMVEGPVDDADRRVQPATAVPIRRGVAVLGRHLQVGQQLVERDRLVQRRQPDLVRGRALTGQLPDDDVEEGVLVLLVLLRSGLLRILNDLRADVIRHERLVDMIVIIALIPLALAALDVYSTIRGLKG